MQYKKNCLKHDVNFFMYAKIYKNSEMYVKIQINSVYKNTIISIVVSLIDNCHLRAIVMIQCFVSHYQSRPIPCRGYRT